MSKVKFVVCDREESYVERLVEYFKKKQRIPFEILAFTDREVFWSFVQKNEVEFLLVEREMADKERLKNVKGCVVILSGNIVESEWLHYPVICKYQSCDEIFGEIMKIYSEWEEGREKKEKPMHLLKQGTKLFAVYSPVGRCGKTGFALTLGQILAEERPTLYLNLEPVAVFDWEMKTGEEANISDLIYFFRQDRQKFLYQLGSITKKIRKLDYIPPGIGWDLGRVKTEEWIQLTQQIFQYTTYEMIVLDLDETVGDLPLFLNFCHQIYMPILEDEIAKRKVIQYEELIQRSRNTEIFDKTKKIVVPFFNELAPEQLFFGKMGQFVREVLLV